MFVLEYNYVELYNNLTRVGTVGSRDWYVKLFSFYSFILHTRPISFVFSIIQNKFIALVLKIIVNCPSISVVFALVFVHSVK